MIRNRKDKLIEAAFGDRDRSDLGALSVEETRELAILEKMCADLPALNDIPEPQISTERLRDAILAQGLKPTPSKSSNNWMWTPVAAFAMAFALFMFRPKAVVEPQVNLGAKAPSSAVAKLDFDAHRGTDPVVRSSKTVAETTPVVVNRTTKHPVKEVQSDDREASSDFKGMFASVFQSVAAADQVIPSETSQPVADATAPSNIVLIDQEQNASAVTPRATEVGNPSNVVVGG